MTARFEQKGGLRRRTTK